MIRLLAIVVAASVFCRWATGRWPWDFLRPTPTRSQAVFRARKLLAVRSNASRDEIIEAHRKIIAVVHPDRGGTNGQVHEANAARDLLLDELPDGN
jgi:DnaJ family protein C protein 19